MTQSEMQRLVDAIWFPVQSLSFLGSLALFHIAQVASSALLAALLTAFVGTHVVRKQLAKRAALLNDQIEAGIATPNMIVVRTLTVAASASENFALGALMAYIVLAVFRLI